MVPVATTLNTTMYSSAIDPYNNGLFETNTKEGKYWWHLVTKTSEGWKKDGISATFKHAYKILDPFKDRSLQFVMDNIMNIMTSVMLAADAAPQNTFGVHHWNADVK